MAKSSADCGGKDSFTSAKRCEMVGVENEFLPQCKVLWHREGSQVVFRVTEDAGLEGTLKDPRVELLALQSPIPICPRVLSKCFSNSV